MPDGPSMLPRLMGVIAERKANPPERSYVAKLLRGGVPAIGATIASAIDDAIGVALAATRYL